MLILEQDKFHDQRCIFQCVCAPPLVNANRQQFSYFRWTKKRKYSCNVNGPTVPWIYLQIVYQLNLRIYSQPHLDQNSVPLIGTLVFPCMMSSYLNIYQLYRSSDANSIHSSYHIMKHYYGNTFCLYVFRCLEMPNLATFFSYLFKRFYF